MTAKYQRARSSSMGEYMTVLVFYVLIYAFVFYMQLRHGEYIVPAISDVPLMLLENIGLNLLLFCGIGVALMAIFNRGKVLSLTVHEQPVIDSVIWIAVIVLIMIVVNKGVHSVFAASGMIQPQSPIVTALKGYFASPWMVVIVGAPIMFLIAGLPEELMRCYAIYNGIRLRSGFLSIFAIVITTFAFAAGHFYEGTEAMVSVGIIGLILGVVYYIRQSFWTQVFIHTVYNVVVLLIPVVAAPKPHA